MFITGAAVEGSKDDLTMGEVEGKLNLAEWRNVLSGDMDVDLRLKSVIFGNDANYSVMPMALIELPLELGWTWRFLDGGSIQVGMRPGIYADAEALDSGFGIPFKGVFYYAVNPNLAWMLGMEVRPGWNMLIMPLVGLAWEPVDFFRLTVAVPETSALVQMGPIGIFGTLAWRNTSYGMSGKDGDPDQLTVEDILLGAGLQIAFSDEFHMKLEGGLLTNRSLLAENSNIKDKLDVDDAPYFRLTFGGSF